VIVDGFADLFKTIIKFMGELPQKVHDMPEDEFQRIVNDPELCEENRQLLIKLRNKGGD
jgi:hypothetical protein